MKIQVDWGLCDGNGVCAVEAPAFFELNDDELILLREEFGEDERAVVQAAVRGCPKHALSIDD